MPLGVGILPLEEVNMAKKAAVKTAGISMAGFQPRAKLIDGQSPEVGVKSAAPEVLREPGKPFTGVGSVMAAITREAEISQELVGVKDKLQMANSKLADLDGAVLVRSVDPKTIRRSQWANRNEAEFGTVEFQQLKEEIASAGGNVQPIKVRVVADQAGVIDGQSPAYEIVYGHRRHQACLELGLSVSTIVVEKMNDRALFEAMDRENRGRKNLSAWEQGRMYEEAVRTGLYPSLRRLAETLGVNSSDASRAVQLAKLPKELVAAFSTPLDLQVRWAKPLTDTLQRDPEGVLTRAREAAGLGGHRSAADVFARLIAKPDKAQAREIAINSGKKKLAVMTIAANGKVSVDFESGVIPASQQEALVKLLKSFLAGSSAD